MEASTGRQGMGKKPPHSATASFVENCSTAPVSPADISDSILPSWSATDGSGTTDGHEHDGKGVSSASSGTVASSIPLLPPPPVEASSADRGSTPAAAQKAPAGSDPSVSESGTSEPRWGNCSTKVSFHERTRRSQELTRVRVPPGYEAGGARVEHRPAPFPEDSELPGGGYWMPETSDDKLPPPSAYEVQEAAKMMKAYHDIIDRLETCGVDTPLVNGHVPKIHDLTK